MMGVNTIFVTSPDDKASNYHVGQKAVSFELQDPRTNSWKIVGKGPDKDDSPTPNNQNAQGRVLVSFDGPGGIVPKGVVPNNFTGTLVQYTKTQALDAKGNPSGPTLYWKTTVAVIDGTPTMTVDVIDENDFNTASDIFYGQKQRRHH
jgi:hypothetical protein